MVRIRTKSRLHLLHHLANIEKVHISSLVDRHHQKRPSSQPCRNCQLQHRIPLRYSHSTIHCRTPLRPVRFPKSLRFPSPPGLSAHWPCTACQNCQRPVRLAIFHRHLGCNVRTLPGLVYRLLRQEHCRHSQCPIGRMGKCRRRHHILHNARCIRLTRRGPRHDSLQSMASYLCRPSHLPHRLLPGYDLPLPRYSPRSLGRKITKDSRKPAAIQSH